MPTAAPSPPLPLGIRALCDTLVLGCHRAFQRLRKPQEAYRTPLPCPRMPPRVAERGWRVCVRAVAAVDAVACGLCVYMYYIALCSIHRCRSSTLRLAAQRANS
jgi:hypothetical protein